jgi:hypothetical protein
MEGELVAREWCLARNVVTPRSDFAFRDNMPLFCNMDAPNKTEIARDVRWNRVRFQAEQLPLCRGVALGLLQKPAACEHRFAIGEGNVDPQSDGNACGFQRFVVQQLFDIQKDQESIGQFHQPGEITLSQVADGRRRRGNLILGNSQHLVDGVHDDADRSSIDGDDHNSGGVGRLRGRQSES